MGEGFFLGFEKRASKTKPSYKVVDINTLNPNRDNEVWSVKIDGAHTVTHMQRGKTPLLYSHRISKKTNSPIPYTQKLPHIKSKSGYNALVRSETYATNKGLAVHPDIVSALLTRTVDNSLALQKEMGIKTKSALIDVDEFEGKDMRNAPYKDKLEVMKKIVQSNPDFTMPDIATKAKEKKSLLKNMLAGKHPQSKEGLVVHNYNDRNSPFAKAKIVNDHDVYVRGIFEETGTKEGRKAMAGGFVYSWDPDGKIMGRVGTGFNHKEKEDMLNNPNKYIGRVAKVRALDLSKNNILVKPSFDGWHVDKNIH